MNEHCNDLVVINAAGLLRSFGVGLTGVVLGIYLFRLGLSSFEIGFVIAAGLAGSALATVVTTLRADRLGRKRFLVLLSLLGLVSGIALAKTPRLPLLAMMAFVGMLNGTGTDRSAAFALDQAIIPGLVSDAKRTWSLAWYNALLASRRDRKSIHASVQYSQYGSRKQEGNCEPYRPVFLGCIRRGLLNRCVGRLLVLSPIRNRRTESWLGLLRGACSQRGIASRSSMASAPDWPREYDGLHSPAL